MRPVRWETRAGSVRWQPRRCDGWVLANIYAMGSGATIWDSENPLVDHEPRAYWWRWVAVVRGRLGDWSLRWRESRQLVSTEEYGSVYPKEAENG